MIRPYNIFLSFLYIVSSVSLSAMDTTAVKEQPSETPCFVCEAARHEHTFSVCSEASHPHNIAAFLEALILAQDPSQRTLIDQNRCIICLEEFLAQDDEPQKPSISLQCGHTHHTSCLSGYFKSKAMILTQPMLLCPVCRSPLEEEDHPLLDLTVTTDDVLHFCEHFLSKNITGTHLAALKQFIQAILKDPQTQRILQKVLTDQEKASKLIAYMKELSTAITLKTLQKKSLRTLLSQSSDLTKEQVYEALYAVLDYYAMTKERLKAGVDWIIEIPGFGPFGLSLVEAFFVPLSHLINAKRPATSNPGQNPLMDKLDTRELKHLYTLLVRHGLPPLVAYLEQKLTEFSDTSYDFHVIGYLGALGLLQATDFYYHREQLKPWIRSLVQHPRPLTLRRSALSATAELIVTAAQSGDLTRLPGTIQRICALHPEIQNPLRRSVLMFTQHHHEQVAQLESIVSHPLETETFYYRHKTAAISFVTGMLVLLTLQQLYHGLI